MHGVQVSVDYADDEALSPHRPFSRKGVCRIWSTLILPLALLEAARALPADAPILGILHTITGIHPTPALNTKPNPNLRAYP
jgi:hypothetical protein